MSNAKLDPSARREMLLRALAGESVLRLSREYSVARTAIYEGMERARRHPEHDLEEAEAEVVYWRRVNELTTREQR